MAVNQFTPPDADQSHIHLKAAGDGSPVQIADADLLFKGDYSRSGNDLEISGSNGKSITIEGYFHTGSTSSLIGPNGAMLSGDVVEALAGPLFPGQYAQSGTAGQAGSPIGEVQHLEGTATATRTDGSVVQLTPGTKVYLGDVVETGSNTKFGLSLEDGSLFSMTSDARMVLNEFVFNGAQAQDSSMLVNLVQGAFVFVAGSIAPTGNMKVETPVAVLAIRGTTVGAEIDAQLGSTTLSLFQDVDSNKTGEYLVLDKATGEIIGQVTEVGNKLIITGVGETPIIVQKDDQDQLNDLSALELIRTIYAKAAGQKGEFDTESGSGSFFDIQLVSLSGSMTIEELAGNPLAMASAQKIVFDTPDQDDPPVAFFDGFSTDEDNIFAGNVISNNSIQPDEDPEGFDVRVVGFGEDLIWEEGVDFDFEGGIVSATGSTTFVLSSGAVVEISANGNFTYNPNPAFDFLADGESAVDSFSYLIADPGNSTDSDTVEVTVFGSNDQPVVISAQASHEDSIVEIAAAQGSSTELVASGIVAFEDLDSTDGHDTVVTNTPVFDGAQWNRAGAPAENLGDVFGEIFGSVELTLTESHSTIPDPGNSPNPGQVAWEFTIADQDVDFLGAGETLVITYIVNVQDDSGTSNDTTSQLVTVTVTGTNDVPLIDVTAGARDITGAIDEIADLSTDPVELTDNLIETGVITFTDVDLSDQHTASVTDSAVTASTLVNGYVLTTAQISALFDAFSLDDGSSRTSFDSVFGSPTAGDGTVDWTYLIADQDIDFLGAGDIIDLSFEVTVDDGNGGTITETVVITVTGTNDVPVITSAPQTGTVTETADVPGGTDTDPVNATGTISFVDVDLSDDPAASHDGGTVSDSTLANGYELTAPQEAALKAAFSLDDPALGNFSQADGTGSTGWTYDVANADIDFLGAGDSVELTYVVTVDDGNGGTTTQDVVVTINGTNDEPVITSAAQSGAVTETADVPGGTDTDPINAIGTISFVDVDLSDDPTASHDGGTVSDSTLANGYELTAPQEAALKAAFSLDDTALGNFSQADGTGSTGWTYDVANADIDFLGAGDSVELTYVVTVDDGNGGSITQDVVVTINGTNDEPVITSAAQSGTVTETADVPGGTDTDPVNATGTISFVDVDLSDDPTASHDGGTVSDSTLANGYELTAPQEAALKAAFSLDDAALGNFSQADGTGSTGWTYDVANADIDFLGAGDSVELTYVVTVDDGNGGSTTQDVVVTINGTNDEPVITSAAQSGTVTETADVPGGTDTDPVNAIGTISFVDVDLSDDPTASHDGGTVSDSTLANGYELTAPQEAALKAAFSLDDPALGNFSQADGTGSTGWTYDVANADIDFLGAGDSVELTYVVTVDDGNGGTTTQDVVVTINGTNDEPVITSAAQSGAVTETADVPGGTDTDPVNATGTISFVDVDLSDDPTASHDGGTVSDNTLANGYELTAPQEAALKAAFSLDDPALGNFSQADGTGSTGWTYDVANADIDFLGAEDSVELTYVVTVDDGNGGTTTQDVVVTINGTNDAPVVAAITQTDLTEPADTSALTTSIAVAFTDIDLTDVGHAAAITEAGASGVTSGLALDEAGLIALVTPGAVTKAAGSDAGSVTLGFSAQSTVFDYLSDGEEVTLTYTVEIDEGDGGVTPQAFVVTISGTNDAPVIASAENASGIIEAGSGIAGVSEVTGDVSGTWSDAENGEQALLKVVGGSAGVAPQLVLTFTGGTGDEAEITGIYGSLFIKEDGSYRYVLDDADADTEALADGQSATDSFNYTIANGEDAADTTTSTINVDITGSDDGPSLNIVNYEDFEFSNENLVPSEAYETEEFGQDLFSFADGALEGSPPYVLTDFVPSEDVLDLSTLLENTEYTPGSSSIEDYVELVDDGTDTTVQFDADGPGTEADYVDLAVLDDVTGAGGINIIDAPLPPVSS